MPTPTIQLYVDAQFASPYAMSVFVALEEKELPFEVVAVDLAAGANRHMAYASASLTQRIPMLVHQGFALSESSAITEYLNEQFPATPVYPDDPKQRGKARQVQAWLRSDLMAIRQERPTEVIFYGLKYPPLSPAAISASQKLFAAAEAMLAADAEYLCGNWCIADMDLALMLNRLVLHGDTVPPRLTTYAAHQWQRPSVQRWLQQARPPL